MGASRTIARPCWRWSISSCVYQRQNARSTTRLSAPAFRHTGSAAITLSTTTVPTSFPTADRKMPLNRYFVAGAGFLVLMIVSPDMYTGGVDSVKAAGYFGHDWTVKNGSFVWSGD